MFVKYGCFPKHGTILSKYCHLLSVLGIFRGKSLGVKENTNVDRLVGQWLMVYFDCIVTYMLTYFDQTIVHTSGDRVQ